MQVTIYLNKTIVEDRQGTPGRRPNETYREALLVWAARHGFLAGVCARLGVNEGEALGLVNRIGLRQEKLRYRVMGIAEALCDGVVRFEGEARIVMIWDAMPLDLGRPAGGLLLPERDEEPEPAAEPGPPAEPLALDFSEAPPPTAVEAHP